jgi:hypothetical protein
MLCDGMLLLVVLECCEPWVPDGNLTLTKSATMGYSSFTCVHEQEQTKQLATA